MKEIKDTVRERLAATLSAKYEHPGRLEECIIDIIHDTPDMAVAAVADLLLFVRNTPPSEERNNELPTFDLDAFLDPMPTMGDIFNAPEFRCEYFHEELPAFEVATKLLAQLALARERFEKLGEAVLLHTLMSSSDHFPYVDLVHPSTLVDMSAMRDALAREPQLFAELCVLLRSKGGITHAASWLASLGCDDVVRASLTYHAMHLLQNQGGSPRPFTFMISRSGPSQSPFPFFGGDGEGFGHA